MQNQKTFNEYEKDLDCFSAVLTLCDYKTPETPISQEELKYTLDNSGDFEYIKKISDIKPNDIIVFLEKTDGLNPYKHAYVVKNSKRETILTRPVKGQKITLTNLKLELKRKKMISPKVKVYRIKSEAEDSMPQ